MDPPKPKSPSSMAFEPGSTPLVHLTHLGSDATRSSSTFVPPILSVSSDDASFGAVHQRQRRASLADNVVRSPPSFDASVKATHVRIAPSQTVVTTASDAPSTTVLGRRRLTPLADNARRLSTSVDHGGSVEPVHNQDVPLNSNVRSETTSDVRRSLPASLADDVVRPSPTMTSGVGLECNQAASFSSTPGTALRGSIVDGDGSVPRRSSVQVADDVFTSSPLSDSPVDLSHIQAVPSIESSIGLRSTVGVVQERRASAATDASPLSSPLDSLADTLHNQAVPSGTRPTDDPSPSIDSAAAHHVLVTDNAAPFTGRSGHIAQIEQRDDASYEHVEGSNTPSSVSRRASHEALVTIGQPISTIVEAAASLDSLYTNRRPQSPSSDHLSMNNHNASHSSISHEPAVPDHPSVVAATSPSDASLRHDVGAAASRLTEAAALLTEAAALLSKASGVSLGPPHEQPHGLGALNACAPAPSTDVRDAAHAGDHLAGVSQGPLDVQNPSQALGTSIVKPDPAFVAAQQTSTGQLTGWVAVEKALKDFDEQEIGGYKEDIDSLLTFTGLYSAVLTAFVIVSYPLLQDQDPTSGSMTTSSSLSSSFQPPLSAIRINILWFASLVISLATASFAILVKQWLRAYMAFATASPQGQLRVRHFRRSGLTAWRVFGIASSLPLLLQISLAFFFAGLCIFTWDVHPTLGKTTVPLVGAWAFLFLAVTIAPSFTARCPYTTPALAGVTRVIRTLVYPPLVSVNRKHVPHSVVLLLYTLLQWITGYHEVESWSGEWEIAHRPFTSFLLPMHKWLRNSVSWLSELKLPKPVEEMDVQKDAQRDLEILASADALQADDHLLGTTIKSALEQSNANWVQLVEFAVQITGNRIPVTDSETDLQRIIGAYQSLASVPRRTIYDIVQSVMITKTDEVEDTFISLLQDEPKAARWTLCIIICGRDPQTLSHPLGASNQQVSRTTTETASDKMWQLRSLKITLKLLHISNITLDEMKNAQFQTAMQFYCYRLLQANKGNINLEKKAMKQMLTLEFTTILQTLSTVYVDDNDIHQLSHVIHSIVDYDNNDILDLKAIEILKLSLLSVRVMYGKIHHNWDSRPRWSSNEAAQWKRTLIWLAHRLSCMHSSQDELAALQQLARSGWGEIPDPTEDSSQEALPVPDYFYLMLWWTAGGDLSQIPSQHPQLLRIAHMSSDERYAIWDKGDDMAEAYRDHPGNLYPPGTEDDNGEDPEGRATSAPAQGTQDRMPNDSGADAEELGVAGVLQQEPSTDTLDVSSFESRAPSEAGLRAADAAEQHSWTNSRPAGSIQPGQALCPMHETIHSTEDTFRSPGERRDSSHDGDGPKKLQPAGNPAELAEGPENLAAIVARQASEKGGAAPSVINSRTIPASLPTSARDETGLAEVQDGSEVTADDVQGYPISDCAASSLCDNAAGEDNSQRADNVAAAAGSSDTILRSNAEPDPDHARADIEADTGGQEQAAEVEAEARAAERVGNMTFRTIDGLCLGYLYCFVVSE